jgi:phosphoribosylamine---glycine ligase
MNILIIGSGGREHALAWKIKQSPLASTVYCSPGNGGIAQDVECVALEDNTAILRFCKENHIELVVIGPEQPLVEGLADYLQSAGIPVFGCSRKAAQLEGSKGFTKDLCSKYGIPTGSYGRFYDPDAAHAYLSSHTAPIVVKADGLAAGKGVIVAQNLQQAEDAIDEIFGGKFGEAGASVVIEEFLDGEEASFFALCDGESVVAFGSAQDHKRVGDGDTGPNTGGMGTYAPPPVMTPELEAEVMRTIIIPTVEAMRAEGNPFRGVLFAGLMITRKGPELLEYNVRFGDPETQSLMMRLKSDIVPALLACAQGHGLADVPIEFYNEAAICVVMASKGYPEAYRKGSEIRKLESVPEDDRLKVFHAGTERDEEGKMRAIGGRVLGVTARGESLHAARERAYAAVQKIEWPEGFYRRDIGFRALKRRSA